MRKVNFLKTSLKCGVLSSNLLNSNAMENTYYNGIFRGETLREIRRKDEICSKEREIEELSKLQETKIYKLYKQKCFNKLLNKFCDFINEKIGDYTLYENILDAIYIYLEKQYNNRNELLINYDCLNKTFENKDNKKYYDMAKEYISNNFDKLREKSYFSCITEGMSCDKIKNNDFIIKDLITRTPIMIKYVDNHILEYNASKYKNIINDCIFYEDFIIISFEEFKDYLKKKNINMTDENVNNIYQIIVNHLKENNNNYFNFETKENNITKTYDLFFNHNEVGIYTPLFKNIQSIRSIKIYKSNISYESLCENCVNLNFIEFLKGSNCYGSMKNAFYNCPNIETLNFENLNMYGISNFVSMCEGDKKLKNIDLSNKNSKDSLSYGCKMDRMFANCCNLEYIFNGKNFNTYRVSSKEYMFLNCDNLNLFTKKDIWYYGILSSYIKIRYNYKSDLLNKIFKSELIIISNNSVKTKGIFAGTNEEEYNKKFNIQKEIDNR